jgi:protein TonB
MSSSPYRSYAQPDPAQARRRTITLALTVVFHALVIFLLLQRGPLAHKVEDPRHPVTFTMMPEPKPDADRTPEKKSRQKAKAGTKAPIPTREAPPPTTPKPAPTKDEPTPNFLTLTSKDFAAADIGSLQTHRGQGSPGAGDGGSASTYGPGEGPGGVQLFEAEWYRKPTNAELSGYLPQNAPRKGWGLVACKTIDNYHVENCQTLGEAPLGSGFARAVRQAAWQFLVRPPRVDGKAQVGSWVRIRIDYSEGSSL